MRFETLRRWVVLVVAVALSIGPVTAAPRDAIAQDAVAPAPTQGMKAFNNDTELRRFLRQRRPDGSPGLMPPPPPPPPSPPPPPPPPPPPGTAAAAPAAPAAPGAAMANDTITSNQVQGVDEGGIVKVAGDYLVILRRGRLFTISTANGGLRPVHAINAYPPDVTPQYDWYDEMLIKGDLVVVIGFSYARGGTEVNRFRIGADGRLSYLDSFHLRSDDYYSSRNYASRLVGDQLVVYSPLHFGYDAGKDPLDDLPAVRIWTGEGEKGPMIRTATARQVYIPEPLRRQGPSAVEAMHTVTRCDLTAPQLKCSATAVLGPSGRTFFVSRNAVYIWVMPQWSYDDYDKRDAFLLRIPFDGGRPAAAQVRGGPVDQFSFNPNEREGRMDVLVTSGSGGDEMWAPEFAGGQPALLRLPMSRFGDGSKPSRRTDYQFLPAGGRDRSLAHNRFVGDHLLYALQGWGEAAKPELVVVPVPGGAPLVFPMATNVTRLEQLGRDGLVVGGATEAVFTTVDLTPGQPPRLGSRFVQPNSREAESRSQAFFYRPDSADGQSGLLGLPVLRLSSNQWLADMLFLRRDNAELGDFGLLTASAPSTRDDGCKASCVDWYGNARPIFLRGRVFALLGYELVEGDASGARIKEVRRVDYSPVAKR